MTQTAFDSARADAAIQSLGATIVRDPNYQSREWDSLVLVIELGDRKGEFGYVYWADDQWEAEGPDDWAVFDVANELREAMRVPGKEPWKKCLIRITRETGKIDIDFDYSGEKWTPDIADPEGFAKSLR